MSIDVAVAVDLSPQSPSKKLAYSISPLGVGCTQGARWRRFTPSRVNWHLVDSVIHATVLETEKVNVSTNITWI